MDAYSSPPPLPARGLTKLYRDAKKSALGSLEVQPRSQGPRETQIANFPGLHRKYRIQKDRLITWGLAWSDDEKGPDGDIDESVARAGLTETVDSVLRNIKEVTADAEGTKVAAMEKGARGGTWYDEARYADLLKDLTASIDTLYDLSRSRTALARGEHPTFSSGTDEPTASKPIGSDPSTASKRLTRLPSYASSDVTLVNPHPFSRPSLSPYVGLPPRIELSALRLPEEGPPPYESLGVPSATRLVGYLNREKVLTSVQNALASSASQVPVLVEYANFDTYYRESGAPPPLHRLEVISSFLQPMRPESQHNLSLLGYFEDTRQPRIGLVYDLPYSMQNRLGGELGSPPPRLAPTSLLEMLKKSSRAQAANTDIPIPPLEDRFRLAMCLTERLYTLNGRGIAHGNLNSSSVIFPTTDNDSPTIHRELMRSPLWSSFDLFSKCSVEGIRRAFNLNIYKHPNDNPQTPGRTPTTDVAFDTYGLALILLEIGLWIPMGDLYKAKYNIADFKLRLEKIWIPKLASKCGSSYMRAVQSCLAVADNAFSQQSIDRVEMAYSSVFRTLSRCCLLDEDESMEQPSPVIDQPQRAATTPITRVKRKPLPSEASALSRQQSEPSGYPQDKFSRDDKPPLPGRLSSVPSLPSVASTAQSRSPFPSQEAALTSYSTQRGEISRSPAKMERRPSVFATRPSLTEFKRKVTLIQQRWRQYRARKYADAPDSDIWEPWQANTAEIPRKPVKKEFPEVQLPQSVVDEWHTKTAYQLSRLVERALKGSAESSSISLTAFGETLESARPTFLVCCTSTTKVKHVLKRHFKFDTSVCEVRVKKDEIRRCRRSKRESRSHSAIRSMAYGDGDVMVKAANPTYQERPLCGASIGAFRDDEHLPPVSFGGIVLVDGQAYGMSVHHMLEADDEPLDDDDGDAPENDADDESDASSIRSFDQIDIESEPEDESTVRPSSTVPETLTSNSDPQTGDCDGIVPGDFEEITVTQPALDDAIDQDLHVDEDEDDLDSDSGIDEDHLLSYKLGQIHASSGLKRTPTPSLEHGFQSIAASLPQEIDWALFELVPPRAHPFNIIKGGMRYRPAGQHPRPASKDTHPTSIAPLPTLPSARVHALGRTSGLATGVIAPTMELVKIHGRATFSASWTVAGDFGVGGDSGAWVVGNEDGRVCGHVVAARRGRTYICPMELLVRDMRVTLGAGRVELPGGWGEEGEGVGRVGRRGIVGRSAVEGERDGGGARLEHVMGALRVRDVEAGSVPLGEAMQRSFARPLADAMEAALG